MPQFLQPSDQVSAASPASSDRRLEPAQALTPSPAESVDSPEGATATVDVGSAIAVIYAVKVLRPGKKRWAFLGSHGATSYLRIHAAQFKTKDAAEQAVAEIRTAYPTLSAKVQPLYATRSSRGSTRAVGAPTLTPHAPPTTPRMEAVQ